LKLKTLIVLVLLIQSSLIMGQSLNSESSEEDRSSALAGFAIDSQITMFYYTDIGPATKFYGDIIGLEKTLDWSWVIFFQTGPSSFIGLVKEGEGAFHRVQPHNAVMLSLVTNDLDLWYARLKGKDDVTFLKPLGNSGPIRSFMVEDPGGYTVEFFQWLPSPE
tara:strand:+ start:4483 stop:4971 length:489 start_codon:yes stop_codon:yes gene_type:complete